MSADRFLSIQTKIPKQKPSSLLQPIPSSSQCWEDLSLDFIIGFPSYKGYTTILVVVDNFSKVVHFGMLPRSFSTTQVTDVFVNILCKHHSLPRSLISDRDPIFLSQFWRDLFKLSDTKLCMSRAYHTRSNGQTEVANKIFQQYLRYFVHHRPSLWGKFLAWAEWSFNIAINASTGLSPFEVMFGQKPPSIPFGSIECTLNVAVESELATRANILWKLEHNLAKVLASMKKWADTNRKDIQFNVGDYVYVRLRPCRQASVTGPYIRKLQKPFFGPFKITNKLGALPPEIDEHHPILEPAFYIGSEIVLIQWLGLPLEEATWEPWQVIKSQFHLEDKVILKPAGDVRITGPITLIPSNESTTVASSQIGHSTDSEAVLGRTSKRQPQRPQHFKDYLVTLTNAREKGKSKSQPVNQKSQPVDQNAEKLTRALLALSGGAERQFCPFFTAER
ncbi:hypothetical protein V8G54_012692 [Vigna mungo]|uniref:Integrase catalytic domain-containing protein n=1 Tax=Vigna mungo TaxID=3915 RepID=A0AAQ3NU85_VIGMU